MILLKNDVCVCVYRCQQKSEEYVKSPGARLKLGCELLYMSAGNQTQNLY